MDHSNPVQDSSVKRVRDILAEVTTRRRQDLEYLATLVSGADRVYLPSLLRRDVDEGVLEAEMASLHEAMPKVPSESLSEGDLDFLEAHSPWPVSGLLVDGVPVHPPGVHQTGGHVTTNRVFGGSQMDREYVRRLLEFRPANDLRESITHVYTRGTPRGFAKRLKELTGRKVPNISRSLGVNRVEVLKRIGRVLPFSKDKLSANWEGNWHDDLYEQLERIKTSAISSAGPPYWVKKPQALSPMVDGVLPILHKAISEGKVADLFREQPELFLGEVKNKLDRYDRTKLQDKTRPYFGLPFHLQALFSMMSQPFTAGLNLFHEKGSNAYGHSWAHGGGEKIRAEAMKCRDLGTLKGRPRFWCYGDDVDLYYRRNGVLYNVAPDFRQMDGSVDEEVVHIAIDYVIACLSLAWGKNDFFTQVAELWMDCATNPCFLVDGPKVYRKKQKDGLMTGVVGTTFFDTVKSALAYDEWATQVAAGEFSLLEEKPAQKFFKEKFGLEIKAGTWNPVPVNEAPVPDTVWAPNKFLGVYQMYIQGPKKVELVPYLPEEDWTALLMTPRDDPTEFRRGRPKESQVSISRKWFDRMRGYMVTGAFSNPLIADWVRGIVNRLDPVSIVMSVVSGGGKGAKPETTCAVPDHFEYPDSSGFPSERWCQNLYFTAENQWKDGKWLHLFPSIEPALERFRKNHRSLRPEMYVLEAAHGHPDKVPPVAAQQIVEDVPDNGLLKESDKLEPMVPITGKASKKWNGDEKPPKPNERSKIVSVAPGKEEELRKRMPTATDHLWKLFESKATPPVFPRNLLTGATRVSPLWRELNKGIQEGYYKLQVWKTPVMSLSELSYLVGREESATQALALKAGLYVMGKREKIVSKVPLITGETKGGTVQMEQKAEFSRSARVVSKDTEKFVASSRRNFAEPLEKEIWEDVQNVPRLWSNRWKPGENPMASLNSLFQVSGLVPVIRSKNVAEKGMEQKVETTLAWYDARMPTPPRPWLTRHGQNSRSNIRDMYNYTLQRFQLTKLERKLREEEQAKPSTSKEENFSWYEEVEREHRARLYDESGNLFHVRGPYLTTDRNDLGKFVEIREDRNVYIAGFEWKQRKKETLVKFLQRTVKKLGEHGYRASYESLKQPTPDKQQQRIGERLAGIRKGRSKEPESDDKEPKENTKERKPREGRRTSPIKSDGGVSPITGRRAVWEEEQE